MKRRLFLQSGSLATLGMITAPSLWGSSQNSKVENLAIKKVHLVFKTHLDVGFTNLAAKVPACIPFYRHCPLSAPIANQ